jgi:hypothetical protein
MESLGLFAKEVGPALWLLVAVTAIIGAVDVWQWFKSRR